MQQQLNKLTTLLRLSPYQISTLQQNYDKYNISRLVKRGGILYAPYKCGFIKRILFGTPADLISPTKTIFHARRGIKFSAYGKYTIRN